MKLSDPNRQQLAYIVESVKNLLANSEFRNALSGHVEFGRENTVSRRLWEITESED
jgi:hypothetical protein